MVGKEECMDIWSLKREGFSNRAIARQLGLDRRTVARYIQNREFPKYTVANRQSGLTPYHEMIQGLARARRLPGDPDSRSGATPRLYREL